MYDSIIIGTGPAGLSAALNLKTYKKDFIWLTELLQEAQHHQELQQESSRHLSFVTETRADIWARVLPGQ